MRERSFRRQQREKAIARARRKWPYLNEHNIMIAKNHRTLCSCAMCGNPRKYFGEAKISEQRKEIRDNQKIEETIMGNLTIQ